MRTEPVRIEEAAQRESTKRKGLERTETCVCITELLCCAPETNTTL